MSDRTCLNCKHCNRYCKLCGDRLITISICELDGKGTFCLKVCDKWESKKDGRREERTITYFNRR